MKLARLALFSLVALSAATGARADMLGTAVGGGIGAVTGAVIGDSMGGRSGAIIGSGVGGAVGAVIGQQVSGSSGYGYRTYRPAPQVRYVPVQYVERYSYPEPGPRYVWGRDEHFRGHRHHHHHGDHD